MKDFYNRRWKSTSVYKKNNGMEKIINMFSMSTSLVIILIFAVACTRSPVSENKDTTDVVTDSIVFVEQRVALADELTALRDTIDGSIASIAEKRSKNKRGDAQQLEEAISKLSLNKDKVVRDLEEVNSTALNAWDKDYVERIQTTIKEVSVEFNRITSEVLAKK